MVRFQIDKTDFEMALTALDYNNITFNLEPNGQITVEEDYAGDAMEAWNENGVGYEEL